MFVNLSKNIYNKSNGSRHKKHILKSQLAKKNSIFKNVKYFLKQNAGRNSTGRITTRHKGSILKQKSFKIDSNFKKNISIVICIYLDSKKKSFIALNFDLEKKIFWSLIAAKNISSGVILNNKASNKEVYSSFSGYIKNFPTGTSVYNVSSKMYNNCYGKAAGVFCTLLQKSKNAVHIRLPSGKVIKIDNNSLATMGKVSNKIQKRCVIGKAGFNRILRKRPSVRGVAMNPVDHPHGGNTSTGTHPKTPWGIPALGKSTVKKNVKI